MREAPRTDRKEDVQLSLTDVRVSSCARVGGGKLRPARLHRRVPPHPQDSPAPGVDLEDPEQDSRSQSGGSPERWAPVYKLHFSSHGNQLPLKGQHLSDAAEARRADRGEEAGRRGQKEGGTIIDPCRQPRKV